jgi:hypothetical protein
MCTMSDTPRFRPADAPMCGARLGERLARGSAGRSAARSSISRTQVLGLSLLFSLAAAAGCATSEPAAPAVSGPLSVERLKMGPSRYETGRVAPMSVSNPGGEISPPRAGELREPPVRSRRRHRRSGPASQIST